MINLNRLQQKKVPILVIDTDPDILDLLGPYDEELSCRPDIFDDWVADHNRKNETQFTAKTLPEDLQETCLRELFYDDHDRYQWGWSDLKENFQEMLDQNGYEEGDMFVVEASPCGWHGQSGCRKFKYNGDSEQFIRESFGSLDDRQFHARLWKISKKELSATVSCHDIPTGAAMDVIKVKECEYCGETFVPKHRNHIYCTKTCRLDEAKSRR